MDKDTAGLNIQDNFLARARKERAVVAIVLNSGKKISGRIRSFDRYTIVLEERGGEQMIFKHAIAIISTARAFGNSIDFARASAGPEAGPPAEDDPAGGGKPPAR